MNKGGSNTNCMQTAQPTQVHRHGCTNRGGRPFVKNPFYCDSFTSPSPAWAMRRRVLSMRQANFTHLTQSCITDFPRRRHSGWITKFRMKRFWFAKALKHFSLELEMAGKEPTCTQLLHLWARCTGKHSLVEQGECTQHSQAPLSHAGCRGPWMPYLRQKRRRRCWWLWGIETCGTESKHELRVNISWN